MEIKFKKGSVMNFFRWIAYPSLFNPISWIMLLIIGLFYFVFMFQKEKTEDFRYVKYVFKPKAKDNQRLRDSIELMVYHVYNTYFFNRDISENYARLFVLIHWPYYSKDDWRTKQDITRYQKEIAKLRNRPFLTSVQDGEAQN